MSTTYAAGLVVSTSVTFVLATIFIVLRLISRGHIMRWVALDDFFLVFAWILAASLSALTIYAVSLGLGNHMGDVDKSNVIPLMKALYSLNVISSPALSMSKLSVLTYYLTTLSRTNNVFRWSTVATIALVSAYTLASIIIGIVPCRGADSFIWPRPNPSSCVNVLQVFLAFSPTNILSDLLILFLPIPVIVHHLRLPKRQKFAIFTTLGFSGFLVFLDITRIVLLQQSLNSYDEQMDYSYNAARPMMIMVINVNLSVVATSVLALNPLVTRFLPRLLRSEKCSGPIESTETETIGSQSQQADADEAPALSFAELLLASNKDVTIMTMAQSGSDAQKEPRPSQDIDFMFVKDTKSLTRLTARQSVKPLLNLAPLFLFWGLLYSFIDELNYEAQRQGYMTMTRVGTDRALYFAGYLFLPLTLAYWVLLRFSWRGCLIAGLIVTSTGNLIFFPSSVMLSITGAMVSWTITGCGSAILESAANAYCLLAGPSKLAVSRLLVLQGVKTLGSLIAAGVGNNLAPKYDLNAANLDQVNLAFLVFCVFAFALAFWFQVTRLPETTDEELEEHASMTHATSLQEIRARNVDWITLALSVIALFCLVGVVEDGHVIAIEQKEGFNMSYYTFLMTDDGVTIGTRLIAALLCLYVKPRWIMLFCTTGTLLLTLLLAYCPGARLLVLYLLYRVFQAPLWTLVFATALQAMGKRTKLAAVMLTTATCGGGVLPLIQYAVQINVGEAQSAPVPVVATACLLFLPLYLTLVPLARKQADGDPTSTSPSHPDTILKTLPRQAPRERVGWDFLTSAVETANQAQATRSNVDFITSAMTSNADTRVMAGDRAARKDSDALTFVTRAKDADVHEMELRLGDSDSGESWKARRWSD